MENIFVEMQTHIAVVTVDNPPANSWNLSTMKKFEAVVDDLENNQEIRVIILTGAGDKCFSAGFDVKDAANAPEISAKGRALWRRIDRFSKPVIAAINGHALGGGLELALACHFRLMPGDSKITIGLTELNLGIIPGWGGTQRLTQLIGRPKALDMILLSRRIGAEEAHTIGIVDQVAPPGKLMVSAMALAAQLVERPPIAVRCVLEAISAGIYEGLDEGLRIETEGSETVRETEDRNEGYQAFLEKRKPVFRGK